MPESLEAEAEATTGTKKMEPITAVPPSVRSIQPGRLMGRTMRTELDLRTGPEGQRQLPRRRSAGTNGYGTRDEIPEGDGGSGQWNMGLPSTRWRLGMVSRGVDYRRRPVAARR